MELGIVAIVLNGGHEFNLFKLIADINANIKHDRMKPSNAFVNCNFWLFRLERLPSPGG